MYSNDLAGGFSTPERMHSRLKKLRRLHPDLPRLSAEKIRKILTEHVPTFSLYRRKYKTGKRRTRAVVSGPEELFQLDLAFFPPFRGFVAVLLAIDCFTRKVFLRCLRSKKGEAVRDALASIFSESGAPPRKVPCHHSFPSSIPDRPAAHSFQITFDGGSEFSNVHVHRLLAEHRVIHFLTNSDYKSLSSFPP